MGFGSSKIITKLYRFLSDGNVIEFNDLKMQYNLNDAKLFYAVNNYQTFY